MPGQETRRERREKNGTFGREDRRTGNKEVKSPSPETAPTLGERAKKIPTDKGWDFGYWWSWGDLNPRPQIFLAQIYMFSVLFCVSPCKPRRRTLIAGPAPLFLACAQGARKQASR